MFSTSRQLALLALSASVLIVPAATQAALIGLGEASTFALLGLEGGTVIVNSATSVNGDFGYGANVTSTTNQKIGDDAPWTGGAYVHSTATFSYTAGNYLPSDGVTIGGAADARLEQANDDALAASAAYAALIPTHVLGVLGDNDNRNVVSTGAVNVVQITSLNYKTDTLTLTSRAGFADYFIINVLGNFAMDASTIALANGTQAANVVFNFPNASTVDLNKAENVINGTFLAPIGSIEYHNPATFNGAIIALNINVHSDFNLNHDGFVIPEPASPTLLALGLLSMARSRSRFAAAL
jgi:choice-of-anchor A domain-containing protein